MIEYKFTSFITTKFSEQKKVCVNKLKGPKYQNLNKNTAVYSKSFQAQIIYVLTTEVKLCHNS